MIVQIVHFLWVLERVVGSDIWRLRWYSLHWYCLSVLQHAVRSRMKSEFANRVAADDAGPRNPYAVCTIREFDCNTTLDLLCGEHSAAETYKVSSILIVSFLGCTTGQTSCSTCQGTDNNYAGYLVAKTMSHSSRGAELFNLQ